MPFENFKIVNAKNLKMKFKKTAKRWHIYSLRFESLAGTQRSKRGFVKKTRAIKLKIQKEHMTCKRTLQHPCFIFSHLN